MLLRREGGSVGRDEEKERMLGGVSQISIRKLETIYIKQGEKIEIGELVATIGFFDGVHRGHQYLIRKVVDEAHRVGMVSAVITFDEHPRH